MTLFNACLTQQHNSGYNTARETLRQRRSVRQRSGPTLLGFFTSWEAQQDSWLGDMHVKAALSYFPFICFYNPALGFNITFFFFLTQS